MTQQKTLIVSKPEMDVSLYPYRKPRGDELKVIETWGMIMDECGREAFRFMAKRMEKDSEAFRQAAGCPSLQDLLVFHVQRSDEVVRDYSAELNRLMAICTKYGADASQPQLR
jgi:hypothetical protein